MKVASLFVITVILCSAYSATPRPSGRIVGGHPADISEYPYQLALLVNGTFSCGASVVGTRWALTAAHCLVGKNAHQVTLRAGSTYSFTHGKIIGAEELFNHPSYESQTSDYDVALIRTTEDLIGENILPIPIATVDSSSLFGKNFTITGWGYLYETKHERPLELQYAVVHTIDQDDCNKKLEFYGGVTPRMFCGSDYGIDACKGDSGGPAVMAGIQIGVVSFGIGCADPKYPGIYARLADPKIRSWIREVAQL